MSDAFERLKTTLSDRYSIESKIGAGGMATVYLADDLKHHRKVAVKVLLPDLAAALGPGRFLQEIEIAANLNHPHILPLFDSGEADGFLYYVMPVVDGETLQDKLHRESELPIEEAVKIASDVAKALDYAHRNGVLHRDIKPSNIMLFEGQALVSDFGIALVLTKTGGKRITADSQAHFGSRGESAPRATIRGGAAGGKTGPGARTQPSAWACNPGLGLHQEGDV